MLSYPTFNLDFISALKALWLNYRWAFSALRPFFLYYDRYLLLFILSDNPTPEFRCFSCNDSAIGEASLFTVSQGKQKFGLIFFHIQSLPMVACRVSYIVDVLKV